MQKLLTTVCLSLLGFAVLAQTSLTPEERKKALSHMKETQNELMISVKGLSDDQLNYQPAGGGWSIAECVEHIAITENTLFSIVEMTLQNDPDPSMRKEVKLSDAQLLVLIENRERKVKTRPEAEPSMKYGGLDGSLKAFKEKRVSNMKFVKTSDDDLRNRYFDFPFGKVDAYQVVLFMSGHTRRHVKQIKEVIASANFPQS